MHDGEALGKNLYKAIKFMIYKEQQKHSQRKRVIRSLATHFFYSDRRGKVHTITHITSNSQHKEVGGYLTLISKNAVRQCAGQIGQDQHINVTDNYL